jgi:N-acetylmuramoyl-L-alanine amidase
MKRLLAWSPAWWPARPVIWLLAALLTGCQTTGVKIDRSYTSENQDSRVLFLVIHYTVGNFDASLKVLSQAKYGVVSSHYLVAETPVRTYQLVDESRRAWHAGPSYWRGHQSLNASSVGIEIVNSGRTKKPDGTEVYAPFPEAQIQEVVALSAEIVKRHNIKPERIVGHNEIQPRNKQDPGPLFPWKRLYEAGLIAWPDETVVARKKEVFQTQLPDAAWFQSMLALHGFAAATSGEFDDYTKQCLAVFQMRYRPTRYDGQPDAETAALLFAVTTPEAMKMITPPPAPAPYTSRW